MNRSWKTDRTFVILNVSFWLLLSSLTTIKAGLFSSSQDVHWAHIFSYTFTSGLLWILFTFFIWILATYYPFRKDKLLNFIALHLLLAPLGSALQRFLSMSLDYISQTKILLIDEFPPYSTYLSHHFPRRWVEGILWYLMITISIYTYIQLIKNTKVTENAPSDGILQIKKKGSMTLVNHKDIIYIESKSNYCFIHTKLNIFKMRSSLKALEENLIASGIIRIHNSYLINIASISGYKHIQNGEYSFSLFNSDKSIFSSKSYRDQTKHIIQSFDKATLTPD